MFYAFALVYGIIALRLTYLQFWNAKQYEAFGDKLRNRKLNLVAQRGTIYDRMGRELAINVRASSIYAHPKSVENHNGVSVQLASLMKCDQRLVAQKLDLDKKFVWLERGLGDDIAQRVEEAGLKGIGVQHEQKRVYPSRSLAAQILGFTGIDGEGLEGVEKEYDRYLHGRNGFVVAEVDADGRIIPETRRATVKPHDGRDVVLTIDAYIQHVTEEALRDAYERSGAVGASAVVLDPKTGEILALANMPIFDPNDRKGSKAEAFRNRAITDPYEPGSTLKSITASAALNEGVIVPGEVFAHCTGVTAVGKRRIRCVLHHPYLSGHQSVDLKRMIAFSCNIGAATLGLKLGPDRLYKYAKAFGLLDVTDVGLKGEQTARLDIPSKWAQIKAANVAFGQGIAVTPLQLACAYGAIANKGVLMRPSIVKEIRNRDGTVYKSWTPQVVRRVVSERVAEQVTQALAYCVTEGTGKGAAIDGYSVGGKTGSAQKVRLGEGHYGGFIASFIGMVPTVNPRLVILVVVDDPKGSHWGATWAAPAFKEIGQKAMWYLRTPRDVPNEQPRIRMAKRVGAA
jgi:cell division protein FtsI/penicillin-binding protein 2